MRHAILSKLQSLVPAFVVMVFCALIFGARAQADTANFWTGCIRTGVLHNLYNVALGTSPSSACNAGDHQVSSDYGDIQRIMQNPRSGQRELVP